MCPFQPFSQILDNKSLSRVLYNWNYTIFHSKCIIEQVNIFSTFSKLHSVMQHNPLNYMDNIENHIGSFLWFCTFALCLRSMQYQHLLRMSYLIIKASVLINRFWIYRENVQGKMYPLAQDAFLQTLLHHKTIRQDKQLPQFELKSFL